MFRTLIQHYVVTSIAIGTALSLAFLLYMVATSVWLIWYILPMQSGTHAVLHDFPINCTSLTASYPISQEEIIGLDRTCGVSLSSDGQTALSFIPPIRQQFSIRQYLHESGWQSARYGLAIATWPQDSNTNPVLGKSAFKKTISALLFKTVPVRPSVIIQNNSTSNTFGSSRTASIATRSGKTYTFIIGSSIGSLNSTAKKPPVINHSSELQVSIPGQYLASLPASQKEQWDASLGRYFNFIKTGPEIINALPPGSLIEIKKSENATALTVHGSSSQFVESLDKWTRKEEAYRNPVLHYFGLPDGTLGKEWIPGKEDSPLGPLKDGCRHPVSGKQNIWLCANTNSATIYSSEEIMKRSDLSRPDSNYAFLSLDSCPIKDAVPITALADKLCNEFSSIIAYGEPGHLVVQLTGK